MRWISPTEIGSTPAKGSSSSIRRGLAASARAISTRRRSPPDRLAPIWSATWRDLQFVQQAGQFALAAGRVQVVAQLQHQADVVGHAELAEHRRFLRQVADAVAWRARTSARR